MLNKYMAGVIISGLSLLSFSSYGYGSYRHQLCNSPYYSCVEVAPGKVVAIPRNHVRHPRHPRKVHRRHERHERHERKQHIQHEKPPSKISGGNIIKVNLHKLTWGAYDGEGNLVKSGRVSGGKDYCPDIGRGCRTVTGTYTVYSKKGAECKSSRFPVGKGGAPMPYCMFFHGGYAMHGSNAVPGHNASHGCVRMPPQDAQWLNQNFVKVGRTRVNITY